MNPPAAARNQTSVAWHAASEAEVLARLCTRSEGLTTAEARRRITDYGRNDLPGQRRVSLAAVLLRQFKSPLIYVLGVAAVLAGALEDLKDSLFIVAVLAINAVLGAHQEFRAERSSLALRRLLKIRASVSRSGDITDIDAEELVPGDLVWLESGNRVPADIRLLESGGLEVDESLLTGESGLVAKDAKWIADAQAPVAERKNIAFAGTMVAHGRARGIVVATGPQSAIGEVAAEMLGTPRGKPPLIARMEVFSRRIGAVVIVAAIAVAALGVLLHGHPIGPMLLFAVALVVSAIPEGLPVALTVTLAVASHRMAKRRVIVRELAAVEGLGSCTLIASDKTGTLTVNELTVKRLMLPDGRLFEVGGEGFVPEGEITSNGMPLSPEERNQLDELLRASALCNEGDLHRRGDGWIWRGDPTDVALLTMAHKAGVTRGSELARHPQVAAIPFEPERRYAASYHSADGDVRVFVKGAPERVSSMCTDAKAAHAAAADTLAQQGFRVLMLASGRVSMGPDALASEPRDLTPLGFVGMIDPLRAGAREAVRIAREGGISTAMVTGDHPLTALAIARELGLAERADEVVTGAELERLGTARIGELLAKARVFARVSPHQKLDIVRSAQAAGHFVAVTGDGVNDAPALRAANIGVAMGRGGTDVAREAAALVITDGHFATITAGIEEGRVAYDNIRKIVYLLTSTGAAEMLVVALAVLAGLPLPLLPSQLLWLNLVTNGIQDVALGFERGEPGVLRRPPRPPHEALFDRLMVERTVIAATVMSVVGFLWYWGLLEQGYSEPGARNELLLLMVLFENFHLLNCRSEIVSAFRVPFRRSPVLLFGIASALLIHVAAMQFGLGQVLLETAPVSAERWVVLGLLASTILVAMEAHKVYWRRRVRRNANGAATAAAGG